MLKNFSEIIRQQFEEDHFEVYLKLNPDHELYKGHFPDQKVTPAVVMIHLFKQIAEDFSAEELQLQKTSNLKFLNVLDPDQENVLICTGSIEKQEHKYILKAVAKTSVQVIAKVKLIFTTFVDH